MIALRVWVAVSLFVLGSSWLSGQISHPRTRITQRIIESEVVTLRGNTYPLARREFDQGPAPADLPMERMLLVLSQSDEQKSDLDSLLERLHDPNSDQFHQWLSPEQFGQRFGISDDDLVIVTNWLEAHGFTVGPVAKGRTVLEFSGTASQVAAAFHTNIHKYNQDGEEHWANDRDPQIPTALAPVVAGIATLHNFVKEPFLRIPEVVANPQFTSSTGLHYLSPADFATIYNVNPLYQAGINGSGRSIAIIARSNINVSDITQFRSVFGLTANPPQIIVNGADPGIISGDKEETILDTSWAGAVAPGATIKVVVSKTSNVSDGVDLSEMYVINNNLADVMTESYGGCEARRLTSQATMISALAAQAVAQGITYFVSSGDQGSATCDAASSPTASGPLSVNILASSPYVVAVGGTQFSDAGSNYWNSSNTTANGSALSYIPEAAWNQSCSIAQCSTGASIVAGGGGASIYFPKPSWQAGVTGIPADGARDIPDISLTASSRIAPYLVCVDGSCANGLGSAPRAFGGTSASAPAFAGIMALIGQKTNARQGQANFRLYQLAATQDPGSCNSSNPSANPGCIFHDVTLGNIAVPGQPGYGTLDAKYQATTGYDLATGLGTVNATNLVNAWNTPATPVGNRALGLSATNLNFVNVLLNATSTQTVWLVNQGGSAISISSVSFTGNGSNAFAQTTSCSTTLASAGTCSVTVTFTPRTTGTFTAVLIISDDAAGSPHTVALSGTGVVTSTPSLLPSSFSFGNQKLQLRSAAQALLITNTTSLSMSVSTATIIGANTLDFQAANACPSVLSPGGSCYIYIVFTPQLLGNRSATLSILTSISSASIPLAGAGVVSGSFQIVNSKSGQVLDISAPGSNALIQQNFLNGQLQQQWIFNPVDNGYFYILNAMSGKVLDDTGASQANGTFVQQYDYLGRSNQQWQLVAADDVHYRIINRLSGKALDLLSGSSVPGTPIQQWTVNGLPQQLWVLMPVRAYTLTSKASSSSIDIPGGLGTSGTFVQQFIGNGFRQQQFQLFPTGNGYYAFISRLTGKVLDVAGASTRNGAYVQEFEFLGGFNQQWRIVQITETVCAIINRLSGKVLDVPSSSVTNGTPIQQWDYQGTNNQLWQLLPVTTYNIVSRASGNVLEVAGGSAANGGIIQQALPTGSQQQRWQLLPTGGGSFAILSDLSGKVLDVTGRSTASGALIQQYEYLAVANQQWLPLSLSNGYFALMNRGSTKALDVIGGSNAPGTMLQQFTFSGGLNQQWLLTEANQ